MAAALLLGSQADQILAEDLSRPAGASLTDSRGASLELRGTVKFDARKGVAVFDANPEQKEALRAWTRARLGESVKVSFTLEDGPTEEVTVPLSMALPGSFQLAGISLPKDASAGRVSRAEEIAALRAKAEAGDVEAQLQLADESLYGTPMDIEEAVVWWRKAAEAGDALSQEELASCYYDGKGGAPSQTEAAVWWRKAAEQGVSLAQFNLACCYETGTGVEQSHEEAAAWWRKAAEQGFAPAQYNLACCYEAGKGVEQSCEEAVAWWRRAADQGFRLAQEALREMELHEQENAPAASHGGMRSSEGEGSESCPVRP